MKSVFAQPEYVPIIPIREHTGPVTLPTFRAKHYSLFFLCRKGQGEYRVTQGRTISMGKCDGGSKSVTVTDDKLVQRGLRFTIGGGERYQLGLAKRLGVKVTLPSTA